ncbi:cytochrome b5-like heme/steroid binding domain-containing protein [Hypoxylon trugodes]|uniref:cytochrome b5-like heme/steroid binding domain-containing protein n=1 Tax=Hypoxylon trugodes TaxID=326681 RepID=UPI0021A23754|nr:cytochrome b5-like heme/steroid binding domain-containing protein [Hypoxylon trugodes]KAI1390439.1 cytochrome b5-like heme/steroid binding domain-containing protein [Hypoxylon trugodes]
MGEKSRAFSKAELSDLAGKKNLHLLILGKVYDVHEFVHEHPGGDLVLLGEGGKDATKAFEDVQHSDEAKELMEDYLVGYCSEDLSQTQNLDQMTNLKDRKSNTSVRRLAKLFGSVFVAICLALLLGHFKSVATGG